MVRSPVERLDRGAQRIKLDREILGRVRDQHQTDILKKWFAVFAAQMTPLVSFRKARGCPAYVRFSSGGITSEIPSSRE